MNTTTSGIISNNEEIEKLLQRAMQKQMTVAVSNQVCWAFAILQKHSLAQLHTAL